MKWLFVLGILFLALNVLAEEATEDTEEDAPMIAKRGLPKINRGRVCFKTRGNRPGVFRYFGPSRIVKGLLLVNRGGFVTCRRPHRPYLSRWGCGRTWLNVVVTDQYNYLIYPRKEYILKNEPGRKGLWYRLPGDHSRSRSIFFSNVGYPFRLYHRMILKVWYGEDLKGFTEGDNYGRACVDVYAWFA